MMAIVSVSRIGPIVSAMIVVVGLLMYSLPSHSMNVVVELIKQAVESEHT